LANIEQGKITVDIHASLDRSRVIVEFSDNGVGIPPAYVEKVFEPFFTTKQEGEGTGLGLSIVYGIIMDHHGSSWIIMVRLSPNPRTPEAPQSH
jgi:signal transduction histidine kinase